MLIVNLPLISQNNRFHAGMQNSKFNMNIPFTFSRIKHAPTEVILKFYKSNINSLSKKDESILVQTFVYVLLCNLFIFGQTIDVSFIKL